MSVLGWIVAACVAMSLIAWIGGLSVFLSREQVERLLLPLVAFSAGSLIGGALLHLIPEAVAARGPDPGTFLAVLAGFALFFLLEQLLAWHHDHARAPRPHAPFTYLILLADGLHNFIGGLAIAASFLVSVEVGLITWLAGAAHEVPQELGDFGILIRGGWRRLAALRANFFSAATILPGGLLAYALSTEFDTSLLLAFAAGNFIYIGASDLIPEVKREHGAAAGLRHFGAFTAGWLLILLTRLAAA